MAERPVIADPVNLGLVAVLVVLGIMTGLLWLGPGRGAVQAAQDAVQERRLRVEDWQHDRMAERNVTEAERADWIARYERVTGLGVEAQADPEMIAHVASVIGTQGIRGLEISRIDARSGEAEKTHEVFPPFGQEGGVRLTAVPVRVRFEADYDDLLRVLERCSDPSSALSIRRVDLLRRLPAIRVELEFDFWRREALVS